MLYLTDPTHSCVFILLLQHDPAKLFLYVIGLLHLEDTATCIAWLRKLR